MIIHLTCYDFSYITYKCSIFCNELHKIFDVNVEYDVIFLKKIWNIFIHYYFKFAVYFSRLKYY